jgi:hypothetical protein
VLLEGNVVLGGGQTPGETIGNRRATAITFAREGARVWFADRTAQSNPRVGGTSLRRSRVGDWRSHCFSALLQSGERELRERQHRTRGCLGGVIALGIVAVVPHERWAIGLPLVDTRDCETRLETHDRGDHK